MGEPVLVSASVVQTEPVVVLLDPDDTAVRLTVRGVDRQVSVGDHLRVAGVLRPGHEIRAHDAIVVPEWGTTYTYTVSAVAVLWVLTRTLREWRFDPVAMELERRTRPLTLGDVSSWRDDA